MGLDMYLEGKVYIGGSYHRIKERQLTVSRDFQKNYDDADFDNVDIFPTDMISEVIYQVGYWRKSNQVHKWFVDNCQDGVDDCRSHDVSKEKLLKLQSICKDLIETKDQEKALKELPPCKGFFFGMDNPEHEHFWEWYWDDIETTLENVERALRYIEKYDAEITYRASW